MAPPVRCLLARCTQQAVRVELHPGGEANTMQQTLPHQDHLHQDHRHRDRLGRVVEVVILILLCLMLLGLMALAVVPRAAAQGTLQEATAADEPHTPAAVAARVFTGRLVGNQLGRSVASAGDVNGDGYDDLLVGVPYERGTGVATGAVYVFFGGTTFTTTPDLIIRGAFEGDYLGWSVASAGDVNGDGYDDILIGAPYADTNALDAGQAYLYFGGPALDAVSDVTFQSPTAEDHFGWSVAGAGDVNGDGYADVLVGVPDGDIVAEGAGQAHLYYGGAAMDFIADKTILGENAYDHFGRSVASAGDVNGDGYSDVVVGAPMHDGAGDNAGRAYVYWGGPWWTGTPNAVLEPEGAGDFFGQAVASAGDINGDGYDDVAVGAHGWGPVTADFTGRVFIYHGGGWMDPNVDFKLSGGSPDDYFGATIASAGDVNGDGYGDLLVGARGYGYENTGRAYLYCGGPVMDRVPDKVYRAEETNQQFGFAVASAGDVNGDGLPDVVIGVPFSDYGAENAGRAYLYLHHMIGPDLPDEVLVGSEAHADERLGRSVASAGDVNGDGYDDVVVGAPNGGPDVTGTEPGWAALYLGGPGFAEWPDLIFQERAVGADYFGWSVASAGDVNGDGYDDVVIGAPMDDTNGTERGAAYVYFGGAAMDTEADLAIYGGAENRRFGWSVASAGDVNGDGYAEFIVGASYRQSMDHVWPGRAYLYLGGPAVDGAADWEMYMSGTSYSDLSKADNFDISVSPAGDVNGDGYADVIVGTTDGWTGDNTSAFEGAAHLYLGSPSIVLAAPDPTWPVALMLKGHPDDNFVAFAAAGAGDVNGDGYADLMLSGLDRDSEDGPVIGHVYFFFGGAQPDSTADLVLSDNLGDSWFGTWSLAGGGDVNGDGYADVIVGTPRSNAAWGEPGWAEVYFGGRVMDTVPDITYTGQAPDDYFGHAVALAGDVNGDDLADVVIGAPRHDRAHENAGSAYLYLSSPPAVVPHITSVRDVENDQGGRLHVTWTRSGYDLRGVSLVTDYLLQRSPPPGGTELAWETVAVIPASHEPMYSYAAPTYADQIDEIGGHTYLRVVARTDQPDQYWRSGVAVGASIDNLAPDVVSEAILMAHEVHGHVVLAWVANDTDADLQGYRIYRAIQPATRPAALHAAPPEADTLLGFTAGTTFEDPDVQAGTAGVLYWITAVDVHGNESVPTAPLDASTPIPVELAAFEAVLDGMDVVLTWTTASETSVAGFAVDHAEAGRWVEVGYAAGQGTTAEPQTYTYRVPALAVGPHRFRLRQIDLDGQVATSPVIVVDVGVTGTHVLSEIYPNPCSAAARFTLAVQEPQRVRVAVYDVLGREITVLHDAAIPANQTHRVTLNASDWASGLYVLRVDGDRFTATRTLTVLK